ncbi:acetyl ornithine aminotransferase family protein [Thermogemmata fonticola]|jgi:4-aminobutyrate aminotransferase|uniref:Acetyl ornithine aminotransferase family protein n=1 Tax=Thermogemmata fonticola TaxID=2755323 RepID=A0A7V8VEE3_9BACT|nr:acetyl ornithine aminotransferase family protein [Thermogemmata fonticola]MBA2226242.1 acetyl ornithine aminotransferase family protein [Thermogemmata fonticola]
MWLFDGRTVPDIQVEPPGPKAQEWLRRDAARVSPSYTRVYPLVVERASGCVVQDVDGNLFLDLTAGIAVTATGHCHPQIVASIQRQSERLIHMSGTDFYYPQQAELAERLARGAPGSGPKKVFFCNSGAEAIEAALKLARWHTRRPRVIALLGAFHGRTYGAMSLSASKAVHRRGFAPLVPEIHHVPFPRTCPEEGGCSRGCRWAEELERTLLRRLAPPDEVAAIFIEPIQGEGGYYPWPPGCLPALRQWCDRHGILLVADEVQSGMGRTGRLFAIEHYGVAPDILCLAKGIASGLPLGAVVARAEIMDWPPGSHASTFGGNPVACAAALATLDLLEREYLANAAARGEQLRAGLHDLALRHPILREVRGLGLMVAADLPSPELRDRLLGLAFRRGLLLLGCGEAALRFCPPLCITAEQIATALRLLDELLPQLA